MLDATTIVPIGNFTPDLSRRVREKAFAKAQQRTVIISLQSMKRYSWSALYDFAESLRATITPHAIHLACPLPRTRSLFRELGLDNGWFVNHTALERGPRILMTERVLKSVRST